MKLAEAVALFLEAKEAEGLSLQTIGWYRRRLTGLNAYLGDVGLDAVTTIELRRFLMSLRGRERLYQDHPYRKEIEGQLSPWTRQGYVRAIKQFFNWLISEGCLAENPASRIKLPRMPQGPPRAISAQSLQALLAAAQGDEPADKRNRALVLFLADTGCRVGGMVSLKLTDLDLDEGVAMVTEKGSKSRPVMFTPMTAEALREYLQGRGIESPLVFPNLLTGEQLVACSVNHILYRLRQAAGGVEGPSNPHAFRHAFAREYILNGGDLATLAEILGHTDVSVTKRFYSNFQFKELQEKHRRFSPVAKLKLEPSKESR